MSSQISAFLGLFCALSVFLQPCHSMHGVSATRGQPWPMPASMKTTTSIQIISPEYFQFKVGKHQCDLLEHAFRRYHFLIFDDHESTYSANADDAFLNRLVVNVKTPCIEPQMPGQNMDESYQLLIKSPNDGQLNSNTIWGALRGLETFSQLIYETDAGFLGINSTTIVDKPRFSHRGVLLDTSRHFLPIDIIYKALDGMSFNKFNVFHWHIVDDDSFPYESEALPELSQKGAFEPYSHVYTQEDIFRIIEYARTLGIRVVPEFDTPGHTLSWGKSHPEFLTKCYSGGKFTGKYGPVDPTKNGTFTLMKTLLSEVVTTFKDFYVHLGGDEVSFDCWKSNPDITAFMKKMGYGTDYSKLEQYYMQKVLDTVHTLPRKTGPIIWQEVLDNNVKVPADTVAHVWKGGYQAELARMTKLGLRTLLSSCWYLDIISYGQDWKKYYTCDPQDFPGTAAQKALVFGGEAALWGELVDATNVLPRLWPRASAVAERLWSPASVTDLNDAARRLEEQRCRMIARDIPAEPVNGPGFCRKELKSKSRAKSRAQPKSSYLRFSGSDSRRFDNNHL